MTNIIAGPWTTPPARKPWRRMTESERATFKAWEDWLTRDVLPSIRKTGGYQLGAGETTPPPLPIVWPEDFNLDVARAVLANLGANAG